MDARELRTAKDHAVSLRGAAVLIAVPFLLGGLAGVLACRAAALGGTEELAGYIGAYVRASVEGTAEGPGVWPLLWGSLKYPLAALVLGFTALGLFGLPVLFFLRGFLAAFALAAFTAVYGAAGTPLALLLAGAADLAAIPALFVIGVQSAVSAGQFFLCLAQGRRVTGAFQPRFWLRAGCALGAAVLWTGAVSLLHPVLISLAAKLCV